MHISCTFGLKVTYYAVGSLSQSYADKGVTLHGRLAQLVQSAWFTPRRSQVRILYRPLEQEVTGSSRGVVTVFREAVQTLTAEPTGEARSAS